MPRGYMEGPAADEAERRLDELERGTPEETAERLAVFGSTADDPEKHFIGWRDEVDPDELFTSGKAWGLSVVRRPVDKRRRKSRFVPLQTTTALPPTAASARLAMLVVAHVRHALQQTAAMGACSPYFPAA